MKYVNQMRVNPDATASELINSMHLCGVLGAGRVARGSTILTEMLLDPKYTVVLALAGPVVAGGLKLIVSNLIHHRLVDAVVSNGANITHDIIETLGFKHRRGVPDPDDVKLKEMGLGRIGDVYIEQKAFQKLEKKIHSTLRKSVKNKSSLRFGVFELLDLIGSKLRDKDSILTSASNNHIPVFAPGIYDSMLGYHLWTYSRLRGLQIDMSKDMDRMAEIIYESKKVGVIVLGGGLPKHFVLGASTLRGGVDAAVQITLDRPEAGSLSGAPLEESISWGKAKAGSKLATIIADFTLIFPLMVAYALHHFKTSKTYEK